jgi:SET domain-containing protein
VKNLSYRSPKTEIRRSPIQGKGLFAKEAIKKNEIVAIKGGYILTKNEWSELEPELGSAEVQISQEFFIAPTQQKHREGSMIYSNHSCNPNISIQGQIVFIALRDITPGEELTHDWATTDDLDYEMKCNCGASNCRKTITGKDWMRKDLQEKYRGYFSWHIQKKIDEYLGGRKT